LSESWRLVSFKSSIGANDRSLKVARTIANLAGEEEISPAHLSEAIQYSEMDRYY